MELRVKNSLLRFLSVLLLFSMWVCGSSALAAERRTAVVAAVEKAGAAVVNIRTEQVVKTRSTPFFGFSDPFFDQFFQEMVPQRTYTTQSLGSGVIIDPRGYVLTNAHVTAKASRIFVALPEGGVEYEATLVGQDDYNDLAVLQIESRQKFPSLLPAQSDDLMIGETVIAIGNPLGLGHSITTGVVSAPRRRIATGEGVTSFFIQTDALINPGNSGGPLLNINGELIGINTAIARQAQGIGFAIPIDTAKRIARDLIEFGQRRHPYLGVFPETVGQAFSKTFGGRGVLVADVRNGSPAQVAGLEVADVLLSLDGHILTSPADLYALLATCTPQNKVRLGLLRGTKELDLEVVLDELPADAGRWHALKAFGFQVDEDPAGLVIVHVETGSAAEKTGLRPGDRVAEVAGRRVASQVEFSRHIISLRGQAQTKFLIVRGNRGYYIELP